jgi:hypothetical protein
MGVEIALHEHNSGGIGKVRAGKRVGGRLNFRPAPGLVVSNDEQPLPIFQQLARGQPTDFALIPLR